MSAERVRIDWSFTVGDSYNAGTITFDRDVWNAVTPEARRTMTKVRVGSRVIEVLDVDWQPTNASYDDKES